jgi:hypothetical protein
MYADPITPLPVAASELPCRNDDPDLWFSEDYFEQLEAARRCGDCPAIEWCRQNFAREPRGVWAGEIRGKRLIPQRPAGEARPCAADDCLRVFEPRNRAARYCSAECQQRTRRRERAEEAARGLAIA